MESDRSIVEGRETFPNDLKGPRLYDYRLRLREKCCQRSIILNENSAFVDTICKSTNDEDSRSPGSVVDPAGPKVPDLMWDSLKAK
jgi:hypothetical protein